MRKRSKKICFADLQVSLGQLLCPRWRARQACQGHGERKDTLRPNSLSCAGNRVARNTDCSRVPRDAAASAVLGQDIPRSLDLSSCGASVHKSKLATSYEHGLTMKVP